MVCTWYPQGRLTFHAVITDHDVFRSHKQGVTQVQRAGHIGRRNDDHKRLDAWVMPWQVRVIGGLEVALLFPDLVDLFLIFFKIINFWQFSHNYLSVVTLNKK